MFLRKENDPNKIEAPHFAPLCSALPKPEPANKADVLDNMNYMESELKRWNDSIAWVNDILHPRHVTDFAFRTCQLAAECLTDENARAMNDTFVTLLATLEPWACTIVREHRTNMLIWNDVSFAAVHAAEKLDPLCLKQNEEISIFLRGHANRAKDMLVTNKAAGYYYGDLPWTAKEVREAEDRIMAPYLMQANQRVSKEHLSGRSR